MADAFPNYSICGLPFYLSGEVPAWQSLAHRTLEEIEAQGITLRLNERAEEIDPRQQVVQVRDRAGQMHQLAYDRLVIATGAVPIRPAIPGLDVSGVYCLHTMADSFALHQHLTERAPRSAIIIGGGYIGLEMADALTRRGVRVTLIQRGASILKTLDATLSLLVRSELEAHGVRVMTGHVVEGIERQGTQVGYIEEAFSRPLIWWWWPWECSPTRPWRRRLGSAWGSAAPSPSPARWRRIGSGSPPLGIAWRPGIGCSSVPRTCHWELSPINRAVSPVTMRWAVSDSLPGQLEPRW